MKKFFDYFSRTFSREYHPYKIPAFGFALIGFIFFLTSTIYSAVVEGIAFIGNPMTLINILFYLLVYYHLVYFNYVDNGLAYNGLLYFVFSEVINTLLMILAQGANFIVSLFTMEPIFIAATFLQLAFTVLTAVSGIFLYIRSRAYVNGRYYKWDVVRNWALVFTILSVLTVLATVFFLAVPFIIDGLPFTTLYVFMFLELLSPVCIALSCFFTLMRLKGF